ncbi:dUTP pyrophosphatase [Virgibacillus halotolerans]|uniref:dUTP diphosphatase n=1 Tax=Virgibacillus halotolerans TaxID=1071053 RepID=UPI00195F87E5|nr:deoxyuridine 5'-triphosphate nucleotidohydrolase [Virgibacillus halotolerans]MBM7600453.1 dUTP pyrophosphatase [Virgibacillus halotolerans]
MAKFTTGKELIEETIRDNHEVLRRLADDKPVVGFKRLTSDAIIPTKAHATDSGFDLYAAEDVVIHPGETAVVSTGVAVQLPEGMEAQVRPRSGITSRGFVQVHLGTVDNEYIGNIGVIVENKADFIPMYEKANSRVLLGPKGNIITNEDGTIYKSDDLVFSHSCLIRKSDRIAQLVVQYLPQVSAVEIDGDLTETKRGTGGFGSSGVREDD